MKRKNTKSLVLMAGCYLVLASSSPAQDEPPSPDAVIFKTLVAFDAANGAYPIALAQGIDGNLYGITGDGITGAGGANGGGNFFRMTPGGSLTVLYNFCAEPNCADGWSPKSMETSMGQPSGVERITMEQCSKSRPTAR